jgi:murein DD-endopeptidase MepM/ murein hydrolase activator NlpD
VQPKIARARLFTAAAVLAATLGAGVASAQTPPETTTTTEETTDPGSTEPGTEQPTTEEPSGDDATTEEEPSELAAAGTPRLLTEETSPSKIYWRSGDRVKFRYEIGGGGKRDLVIKLYKKGDRKPRKRWQRPNIEPHTEHAVRWGGSPGVSGTYKFRVSLEGGKRLDRSNAKGDPSFRSYTHKFPVRGGHTYGDGYGAGRGHRGQDVFAGCGTTLVAARAGTVQHKAYQGSGAGHYIVIDGKGTNRDYVYMHLQGAASVREGQNVKTGKVIGDVGDSGNATGCHLHFELWKGDWYGGGHAMPAVTKHLKRWDRWG